VLDIDHVSLHNGKAGRSTFICSSKEHKK
jgi:hypothetical protein